VIPENSSTIAIAVRVSYAYVIFSIMYVQYAYVILEGDVQSLPGSNSRIFSIYINKLDVP